MSLQELMAEKLGSGKKGKKKPKLHMNIHQMDDGKFHVEHQSVGGEEPTADRSEHAPADIKALLAHVQQHFGGEEGSEPAPSDGTPEPAAPAAENA